MKHRYPPSIPLMALLLTICQGCNLYNASSDVNTFLCEGEVCHTSNFEGLDCQSGCCWNGVCTVGKCSKFELIYASVAIVVISIILAAGFFTSYFLFIKKRI